MLFIFLRFFLSCTSCFFFITVVVVFAAQDQSQLHCDQCGNFSIPFPFYINNSSCPKISEAFELSCINSSTLFLNIDGDSYRVLNFYSDGILLDFLNTSVCKQYYDLKSFGFTSNDYFGISKDNMLDLYDCEDSSLCRTDCDGKSSTMPSCDGKADSYVSCCYPLSDTNVLWGPGRGLGYFSQFGCRGFSSWVVSPGYGPGKRGVKLEWAVPRNLTEGGLCAEKAEVVNATSVESGIRCLCPDGFVGDGYKNASGCVKSCFKNGKELLGDDCDNPQKQSRKKAIVLAGVITSAVTVVLLSALLWVLKRRVVPDNKLISDGSHHRAGVISKKVCKSRLFTYNELEEATKGFSDEQKIVESSKTTLYAGTLTGGLPVAVQKISCRDERELIQVLSNVELLASVMHRNMSNIIGWSIDHEHTTPMVVYDYPENGNFRQHLINRGRDAQRLPPPLDWCKRLNVAAETASFLAYLQREFSPPIFHQDLQSGRIFLDKDYIVKVSGFDLADHRRTITSDVYNLGLILLEIITGSDQSAGNSQTSSVLEKIKNGKIEEIVDPSLYYHEQPSFRREQIDIVADIATRCLLFGGDRGKFGMIDVARELAHVTRNSADGSNRRAALEETFSNSSLLQMVSMSPESIYVP